MQDVHAQQQALDEDMQRMLDSLDKKTLRPLQKESFLCAAKCCDTAVDQKAFQRCGDACETKVRAANKILQQQLQDFNQRIQRCAARCQDVATENLGTNPSEDSIRKAEDSMAKCVTKCLTDYRGKLPTMARELESRFKDLK